MIIRGMMSFNIFFQFCVHSVNCLMVCMHLKNIDYLFLIESLEFSANNIQPSVVYVANLFSSPFICLLTFFTYRIYYVYQLVNLCHFRKFFHTQASKKKSFHTHDSQYVRVLLFHVYNFSPSKIDFVHGMRKEYVASGDIFQKLSLKSIISNRFKIYICYTLVLICT